ncbi:FecR family protein [Flagellimonas taeanensis]|uniref:FecR family protein n=1 Tax=Flagellimonas taeanensis TaxID=1005926 RepID=A0A1M6WXI2_9FLAO|nr:FecR domain-containing protein [Allomuricauda taeanensis]MEE1964143.1 FecR domain-containing protein [Allomuricauda taeanensis]SFB99575.1 FecR family protein [Allomuricauda taeanensis]SHK98386.1 FecR family protein [Allomuricauda taeanensis]
MRNNTVEEECIRYLAKEGSEEERFLFEVELSINDDLKKEYAIYKKIWEEYPVTYSQEHHKRQYPFQKSSKRTKLTRLMAITGIAAALVVGWLLTSDLYMSYPNKVTTQSQERVTFYLPDSTKVILNSESSLAYHNDFLTNRTVHLTGEAFFDVVHNENQPFMVFTEDVEVLVLGTEFNVNTSDTLGTISLEKGKVNVRIPDSGMNVTLYPNEQVVYDPLNRHIDKKMFDPKEALAWKDEVLVLRDEILEKALPKINNYYGVQFVLKDSVVANKSIKGLFKGKNIDDFKEAMEFITGVAIESLEEQTYLIHTNED